MKILPKWALGRCALLALSAAAATAIASAGAARSDSVGPLEGGVPVQTTWSATPQFSALKAVGPDHVRFSTGPRWRVRAEGDPRTVAQIRFQIHDGQLVIGRKPGERGGLRPATIYVTAPALYRATIGGSGSLAIDRLSGKKVSASVAGSGGLSVGEIDAGRLDASVAGSGSIALAGRSRAANLSVAGSGAIAGERLTVDKAETAITGSGSMAFRSDGSVTAAIVGDGVVAVRGRADCTGLARVGSGRLSCAA